MQQFVQRRGMRQGHADILREFGAELIRVETRKDNKGALAYIVLKDGVEYRWACSTMDRRVPPWELTKRPPRRYKYGNRNCIYRMYNSEGALLYIGKTKQLDYRLYAHFVKTREDWKDEVASIDVCFLDNEADMHVYEMYLITKTQPVFNRDASCVDTPSFELPELTFEYITDWE